MPQYAQSIRKLFHKVDPFEGFDFASQPLDLQGGGGTPILKQVFDTIKPKLVVEVGYDHYSGGRFRHGTSLMRFRPDKSPRQCTMEQVKQKTADLMKLLK